MNFLFVALGGAVGAMARYAISLIPLKTEFPFLTLITNVIGAILIGFIVKPKYVSDEVESSGKFKVKKMYNIVIKFVVPICMVVILVSSIVGFV